MKTIDPKTISIPELHGLLLGSIAPRPIAFASTIDLQGNVNLSPFSFFNVFSANPPILVFSPARRVKDNTTKHTLQNVVEVKEVCISMVNYAMVQQVSLASTEYDKGVNEFAKSGFTEEQGMKVKPPWVKESPVSFECLVKEVQALGKEGGAGNLVICEVVMIHLDEAIFDDQNKIDPLKIDTVARMGGDWYSRASQENIFKVTKPLSKKGIGIDQLPNEIRSSIILTGNQLAMLANVESQPGHSEVLEALDEKEVKDLQQLDTKGRHQQAQVYLENNEIVKAWATLIL